MLRSVSVVVALSVGLLWVGNARAQTPFGGDDTGFIPPAKSTTAKCEAGAGKAADKLIACILKCHASRASGKYTAPATAVVRGTFSQVGSRQITRREQSEAFQGE